MRQLWQIQAYYNRVRGKKIDRLIDEVYPSEISLAYTSCRGKVLATPLL